MGEFLEMGGYAVFVWSSYAAMAIVFGWNLLAPRILRSDYERRMKDIETPEEGQ